MDNIQKQIDELEKDLSKKIEIFVERSTKMTDDQMQPKGRIYTTMINIYGKQKLESEAMALFSEMIEKKIYPSVHTFSVLIDMYR